MALYPRFPFFDDRFKLSDELFRSFFTPSFTAAARGAGVWPPVNLFDDGNSYLVRAEMPGVNKDSLEVTVKGDQLLVKGEREVRAAKASYHRREREGGTFSRTFTLPEIVDADRINASYKNGVLEVTLPRVPKALPRKIQVH